MEEDEDAFLYGEPQDKSKNEEKQNEKEKDVKETPDQMELDDKQAGEEAEEEEEESESDSDIEIVIQGKPGSKAEPPSRTSGPNNNMVMYSSSKNATKQQEQQQPPPTASTIDIEKVGQFNNQPITQVNIEQLNEKPWRNPGADISDYFNYGFDEFTWTAYLTKQDHLRKSFSPQAVMAQMMQPMDMQQQPPPPAGAIGGPPMGIPMGMMPMDNNNLLYQQMQFQRQQNNSPYDNSNAYNRSGVQNLSQQPPPPVVNFRGAHQR